MQLLHIEVWIGGVWQRVLRLDGKCEYWSPKEGSWDEGLSRELEGFLKDHPEAFWVETPISPHGVYFGSGAPRLFRLVSAR
ncbi:hypothetical protein ACWGBH_00510 [Streptomyces massasporeus]